MPMPRGTRLQLGEKLSKTYSGLIEQLNGRLRRSFRRQNGTAGNIYYRIVACTNCGKEILHDCSNNKSKRYFCSVRCQSKTMRNESVGNRIKKMYPDGSYHVLIKVHDHPRMDRNAVVREHILVAERELGRFLEQHERVHHINCIKNDNAPENLFVFVSQTKHFIAHGSLNRCVNDLLRRGALKFDEKLGVYFVPPIKIQRIYSKRRT